MLGIWPEGQAELEDRGAGHGNGEDRVAAGEVGTIAVFVCAFAVLVALSRYFLVSPGTEVTLRNNVLFETDSGVRLRYLTDTGIWAASRLEFLEHPAFFLVWRPIGIALTFLIGLVASPVATPVLAAQTLICAAAAAGVTALFRVARQRGLATGMALVPPLLLVFATSTILVVVPEHWAMAQGLMLSAFFLLGLPGRPDRRRLIVMALLCALIAATTVTNAMFALLMLVPLAVAGGIRLPGRRVMGGLVLAGLAPLVAAGWVLTRLPHVAAFFNLRLIEAPLTAVSYMLFGLVGPIIGPVPWQAAERQHLVLSYEPVSFAMYSPLQWIGVVAWIALLVACAWFALRDRDSRWAAGFLVAWTAYNLVFHNLWGDEFFLYSAHWAWALVALVALGMRHISARLVLPAVAFVVISQASTFLTVGRMLRESPYRIMNDPSAVIDSAANGAGPLLPADVVARVE